MGLLSTIGAASGRAFGFTRSAIAQAVDAYFNLTTLLLPGNGTNGAQNNTFLDSSSNNFTITRNGNTTQGTFSPFSQTGWSNYFDGNGDYLTGNGSLTTSTSQSSMSVEGWFYPTTFANKIWLVGDMDPTGATNVIAVAVTTGGLLEFYWYDGNGKFANSTTALVLNQWNWFAVVVNSNAISMYVNSTTPGQTGTTTLTNRTQGANFAIGAWSNSTTPNGYISNLRWSTSARTISSIPTAPYTSDANTRLLTCQSNRFVDNSSNGFTLTPSGTPSVQAFSPFAPTAAYSAATVGGSGYFDGTGDMLETPSITIGTNNFCFECWLYPTATQGATTGIFVANTNNGLQLSYFGTTGLGIAQKGVVFQISGTELPIVNAWNHVAFVRSGTGTNQTSIFLNGVRIANGTVSYSYAASLYQLSTTNAGGTVFQGYIAGARLTNGSTPYDATQSTLTIPTAPPTTSASNTTLLLNFTNAGIIDATAKNDLETVGNAQISTTQSKFGGSSMYFDGTGDWLIVPNNAFYNFGSSDFTIEFWWYPNTTADQNLISKWNSGTEWILQWRNAGNFRWAANGSVVRDATYTLSTGAWIHIAVSCASGNLRIFVNGTQIGTTATQSSISATTEPVVIGAGQLSSTPAAVNGYFDDVRITRFARYTANFTAPTSAFALQ